jgi:hypothetical protein
MQIFAYTECPDFHALLEVECKEYTGVRPIIHSSVEDLKNMLGLFPTIDVLVLDFPDNVTKIFELRDLLLKNTKRVKKAFVLGNEKGSTGNVQLFTRMEIMDLFGELRMIGEPEASIPSGWTTIPFCTLVHFKSVPFDLYLRLSDKRYVKRIHAHEEIGEELLASLHEKGVTEMFCEKKHNRDFSMMLINNMINKVDRSYGSIKEQLKAQEEVFGTTKEIIHQLGLSGRVIEVCEATIERMCLDVLSTPDEFAAHLLNLKNDKNLMFHFKLINLTNYIGTQLILEMKLSNTEEQVRKLVFASFFCDMTLKNPAFHKIRKTEDTSGLSQEEFNEVNFHALQASELVSQYRNIPKEVSLVIRQHHGSFGGMGFPVEKSGQLLPLSKILIISQDLAYTILTNADAPILETLREFLKEHHSSGLKDLLKLMESSLNHQKKEVA